MKLVRASYEILDYPKNALQNIERAGRTCYKSEDKITESSAVEFVKRILSRKHDAMLEFGGIIVVKFTSNRGFTHELVRHRLSSFAQESTRYVNYSKGKFGKGITCIDPTDVINEKVKHPLQQVKILSEMLIAWEQAERHYMNLIDLGAPPEIAREVLPIGLKAEIVIQANTREWRLIFKQRTSAAAHPRMRECTTPLLKELQTKIPVLFDDIQV